MPMKLKVTVVITVATGFLVGIALFYSTRSTGPPTIDTATVNNITKNSSIEGSYSKEPQVGSLQAQPKETIIFESDEIPVSKKSTNAVALEWSQQGEAGLDLEVRTKNKGSWTDWTPALQNEDRKDTDAKDNARASTLVLADTIKDFQYRFSLRGNKDSPSALIDLSEAKMTAIDSSKGPDKLKLYNSVIDSVGQFFGISKKVQAVADGPRIISRAEWGSPEPNGSPAWQPEYHKLGQAVIHHTVSTETPNSFAAVRAIWSFHTYGRGWGDIGYNYLVDGSGNIFQGRYYDQNYAFSNSVEVEAGHTYGYNKGTIGIAAIGNFQTSLAPTATLNSISTLIAFKFAPYNLNPYGAGPFGTSVVGHRDLGSTACPGHNLYYQIPNIRARAASETLAHVRKHLYDYQYAGQYLLLNGQSVSAGHVFEPGEDVQLVIRLKNYGFAPWHNTGPGQIRLGTTNPTDRQSQFYKPSAWIAKNRSTSFTGKVVNGAVQPADTINFGEVAEFKVALKIPDLTQASGSSQKTLSEYFRPVIDGQLWFPRDIGLFQPIKLTSRSYSWQYQGQGLYLDDSQGATVAGSSLVAGQRYYAVIKAKNTGTATWKKENVRIGTSAPGDRTSRFYDSSWLNRVRPATLKEDSVAPGQTGTFEFWMTAPSNYKGREYFRPVVEGVTWLNDLGQHFYLESN